jgi:serine phosphatase RsbU (regulator of sigma subunit)
MAPLLLPGRAHGVLLAVDARAPPLVQLARQAAAALALADVYTDVYETTRRRRETSLASEIQQNLLPPRIARISGGILAGNVLPGYEIGGDWFDYVENSDGAWIGVADSMGKGTTAAALAIHHTMLEVALQGAFVNVLLGRWPGPSSMFSSITCGHQPPLLITEQGELIELDYTEQRLVSANRRAGSRSTGGVWSRVNVCCCSPTGCSSAVGTTASRSDSTASAE